MHQLSSFVQRVVSSKGQTILFLKWKGGGGGGGGGYVKDFQNKIAAPKSKKNPA